MCRYFLSCFFCMSAYCVASTIAAAAIVGGNIAKVNQFPYFVSVRVSGKDKCGGAIIGDKYVLTAAHCIIADDDEFTENPITILAGSNDMLHTHLPAVIVEIEMAFVPTDYKHSNIHSAGDIAVLKLKDSLLHHKHLKKIHLPSHEHDLYHDKTAHIPGFGWDWAKVVDGHEIGGNNDTRLKFTDAHVLTPKQCALAYAVEHMPNSLICARVKQTEDSRVHGTCIGDSGGPLVYENTVIGVLSYGPTGCSEDLFPGVYASVAHYLSFIHNSIKDIVEDRIRVHIPF